MSDVLCDVCDEVAIHIASDYTLCEKHWSQLYNIDDPDDDEDEDEFV